MRICSDKTSAYSDITPVYSEITPAYSDNTAVYSDIMPAYSDITSVYSDNTPVYSDNTPVYSNITPAYSDNTAVCNDKPSFGSVSEALATNFRWYERFGMKLGMNFFITGLWEWVFFDGFTGSRGLVRGIGLAGDSVCLDGLGGNLGG